MSHESGCFLIAINAKYEGRRTTTYLDDLMDAVFDITGQCQSNWIRDCDAQRISDILVVV